MPFLNSAGAFCELLAQVTLLATIVANRSAAGVSLKSQVLLLTSITCRYMDVATAFISWYNTAMKLSLFLAAALTVAAARAGPAAPYDAAADAAPLLPPLLAAAALGAAHMAVDPMWLGLAWGDLAHWQVLLGLALGAYFKFGTVLDGLWLWPQLRLLQTARDARHLPAAYVGLWGAYRVLHHANWVAAARSRPLEVYVWGIVHTGMYCTLMRARAAALREPLLPEAGRPEAQPLLPVGDAEQAAAAAAAAPGEVVVAGVDKAEAGAGAAGAGREAAPQQVRLGEAHCAAAV